jgi:IstB-like ATP binding protein
MTLADVILSGDEAAITAAWQESEGKRNASAKAIWASVGSPPWSKPCQIHPGEQRPFSSADSAAARVPCYADCPVCELEREVLAPRLLAWRAQGLPPIYFGVKLADLDFSESERAIIEEFDRKRVGVLCLLGNAGTGKTSAACAILQTKHKGCYTTRADLLSKLRATYTSERGGPTGDAVKRGMVETPMLVLDEFEKTDSGGDGQRLLFELLDGRYREGRPTIICGNCSLDDFKRIIGGPGYSRVTGSGGTVLEFTGQDRRPGGKAHYAQKVALIRRLNLLAKDMNDQ